MLIREENLSGVHPALVFLVRRGAEGLPFSVGVLEGVRDRARQAELVAAGASWTMNSRHLIGCAVDVAPFFREGRKWVPSWHWSQFHILAAEFKRVIAEHNLPVAWGGDWRKRRDGPHWEIPARVPADRIAEAAEAFRGFMVGTPGAGLWTQLSPG